MCAPSVSSAKSFGKLVPAAFHVRLVKGSASQHRDVRGCY